MNAERCWSGGTRCEARAAASREPYCTVSMRAGERPDEARSVIRKTRSMSRPSRTVAVRRSLITWPHEKNAEWTMRRSFAQRVFGRDAQGQITAPPTFRAHQRFESPGAAIVGTSAELVSGRTIHLDEHGHGVLSYRLGQAVIPGGRIIWQTCNLGDAMAPHMSFLAAFSARVRGRTVSAASGETMAGTTGLQGGAGHGGRRDTLVFGPLRRP